MSATRTSVIRHPAGLQLLEGCWNDLLRDSAADSVFLTWEWQITWWRHLAAGRHLAVVAVWMDETLIALAPFVRGRRRLLRLGLPAVELMGSGDVGSDYLDVIIRIGFEQTALQALADALAREGALLDARRLDAGRSDVGRLAARLEPAGWSHAVTSRDVCPYIPLSGETWDTYLAGLGREHRYNTRRRMRQLAADFTVHVEQVSREADRQPALEALIRLHMRRWSGRGGSTAFYTPALRAFHADVTRQMLARGWLRLLVLRLDGEIAAVLYGLSYNGRFHFYQAGFDQRFASYSVGLVLMARAIATAIDEGAETFDLLHGNEPYKALWARESRALESLELYPPHRRWIYRAGPDLRRRAVEIVRRFVPATGTTRAAGAVHG